MHNTLYKGGIECIAEWANGFKLGAETRDFGWQDKEYPGSLEEVLGRINGLPSEFWKKIFEGYGDYLVGQCRTFGQRDAALF